MVTLTRGGKSAFVDILGKSRGNKVRAPARRVWSHRQVNKRDRQFFPVGFSGIRASTARISTLRVESADLFPWPGNWPRAVEH